MTGYLDDVIRPLILVLLKMRRYIKFFKEKDRDKNKNAKLMSLHRNDDTIIEKYPFGLRLKTYKILT